ncbi:hypothetical protein ACMD2_21099 [Ananas comosus]|uniref:Uncharacterized protein n=1 Tax=Ananas comosus TaxID=4615 RepID=A0A199W0S5_ANACO|nr:hypothetical protein ACMD2_21099 [Ananas comosus]
MRRTCWWTRRSGRRYPRSSTLTGPSARPSASSASRFSAKSRTSRTSMPSEPAFPTPPAAPPPVICR